MKKFWIAFAIGAAVGGVAALLYAPQSGPSSRRKLRRSFEDIGDSLSDAADYLKDQAERLSKEAQRLLDSSKAGLDDALETAEGYTRSAYGTAKDTASKLM